MFSDWIERFYPIEANRNDYFSIYARTFSTIELPVADLDLTGPDSLPEIIERAPEDFHFSINIRPVWVREMTDDLFKLAHLARTAAFEKIECILVSYPETFYNLPENKEILAWLKSQLEIPLVVELLSQDWIKEGIREWFKKHSLGFCCSDLPRLPGLAQPVDWVTGPIAYVRFHGRNYEKWASHAGQREQNDHTYDLLELAEWLPKIEDMNSRADLTMVIMTNTYRAQAAESALVLKRLLDLV
ncbi:MAG: DUF72 domain-containing protein [Anaerolineales bacterium]|nr:DUF72 domain-containing protein [Anaerolineales bacterium]